MRLLSCFWILACALSISALAAPRTLSLAQIVLTSKENGVEPEAEFFCAGTIHGYIRLPERAVGRHLLEGNWILPNGKRAASSRIPVDFPPPGRSTAYLWFAFPEREGLLPATHPDADAERQNYPGLWHVQVRWDEKTILTSSFTVTCR